MSFIEELKRRNVVRVGVVYLIASWLLAQVADLLLENFQAPDWVIQAVLIVLLVGFPLALILAWAFELTPEGIKKEKDVDRSQSITSVTGRKLDRVFIVALVIALAYFVWESRFSPGEVDGGETAGTGEAAAPTETTPDQASETSAKSVAVLPFVNMSSDTEQEYFSDGISEEILNSLAKVKELKVAGRTSSFAFKGKNQDLRQIGETLGVEHILEGSVRKAGTTVRITAQLIQVEDGFHLWSETYDRELDDVFAIQDEIATAILTQLKAHLLDGEQIVISSPAASPEAYDLYLLAKQRIYERSRPTLEAAAELLDRAIAIDPDYAPAYAQRGITALLLSVDSYGTLPKEQSLSQAKLYLDQALRLDPQLPEALAGLGLYYGNVPGKTSESIEALEKALAINPNLINASNWLQSSYADAGRLAEGLQILEQMALRDPLYRPGIANLNNWYVGRGDLDKARAMVERLRPFMPNDPFLLRIEANIQYATGNAAKGLVLMERAMEIQPDHFPNANLRGMGLLNTAQFERLAEVGVPWQRTIALWVLGRTEEATILAWERANSGEDVTTLIGLLANSGKPAEAVLFFEERWDSLDAFVEEYPPLGSGDVGSLLDIAFAYGSIGNQERFDDAMAHSRSALDALKELGVKNSFFTFTDAVYFTMAGEREKSLVLLSSAVDEGLLLGTKFSLGWDALKVLEGDPQFEAIQARMVEHMNAERAELGLGPVTI
jgi:TolB-like protein